MKDDRQFKLKLTEMGLLGTGRTYWFCQVYEQDQIFLEYDDNESTGRSQVVENTTIRILDKLHRTQWLGGEVGIHYYRPYSEIDGITKKISEFKVGVGVSLWWSSKPLEYPLVKREINELVETIKKQLDYKEKN